MFKASCLGLFAVLILACHPVGADGGIFGRRLSQSCGSCNYYQPYYPVQKVIAQQAVLAPMVVTVPVVSQAVPVTAYGVNHWYSVEATYQQQNAMRAIVREELRSYAGGQVQQSYQPQLPAPQTASGPGQNQYQQQQPQAQQQLTADDVTPLELQQQVIAAFSGKANCINCHGANPNLGGNFRLVAADSSGQWQLLKLPSDKRWKTYAMAAVGAMPPAAANDADKAMEGVHLPNLLRWASIK